MKKISGAQNNNSYKGQLEMGLFPCLSSVTFKGTFNSTYFPIIQKTDSIVDVQCEIGYLREKY